jgi:RimJ/RimL family protein N-acetyltransferase
MTTDQVKIRPLVESDLDEADRIVRLAFGTLNGLPEPLDFMGDADYVHSRWKASPSSVFAAEVDGKLVGSNFAARWGSFGFFGPLSIDPVFWNRGFASALIEPVIDTLEKWKVTHAGLFTHAESPRHIALYQKFGFRPRSLTLILEKTLNKADRVFDAWTTYSQLDAGQRGEALALCRQLTDGIYSGLDVTPEIESIQQQSLGDTVLLTGHDVKAFAACHTGPGSEAGSGVVYVKFGAVRAGRDMRASFRQLLDACNAYAVQAGATRVVAGVSVAREDAYEELLSSGFRISRTGISMHRPNQPGFNRPGVFVIDDWR